MRAVLAMVVGTLAIGALAQTQVEAAGLVDHRAIYKMALARTTPGSNIIGLSGQMAFEVKSTCEGSAITQLLKTETWGEDQVVQQGALSVSSYETKDARSFRFALHNEIDGRVVQNYKGELKRDDLAKAGTITFEGDAFPPKEFPAAGVFPNQYMARLLNAAEKGERVVSVTVYDGAEKAKVFRSTSIIGPKDLVPKSQSPKLSGLAHWPMVLSYFLLDSQSPTPDYESSFDLYENGVSDRIMLDYGDFAMKGEITALELLPMPKCGGW